MKPATNSSSFVAVPTTGPLNQTLHTPRSTERIRLSKRKSMSCDGKIDDSRPADYILSEILRVYLKVYVRKSLRSVLYFLNMLLRHISAQADFVGKCIFHL